MGTIGQRVHHPEALELLRAAGAEVVEPDLVKIPRELVEKARRTAPAVIEVYDRAGEHAMSLGRYNTYFGNGSAVTSVYDVETGEHRPTVLADGEMAARLCDALPNVDFVMAYAHPGDGDPHLALLESFRAMVKNTTKPLVVVAENAGDLAVMADIAAAAARRRRGARRQAVLRPLRRADQRPAATRSRAVDKLLLCADRGIPCVYSTSPLAGGTAPITVAGHVAQGAAESLLGLVIHQLRKPGAPFVFGIGPAVLDMATMQSAYNAPEYLMGYVCAVELARWLDLPNWGYAGTTDAQVIDAQAGMEAAELTFLSLAIGSNLNHDIGYLDYGMTGSLELIVLTDEFLAHEPQALRRRRGDAGDAGRRRRPRRRPRRRLPRPPPHRQERAQGAVAADDHQPPGPRALGRRGRARPQGESPPQGPQAARDAPAGAAAGRAGGAHRRAGRRVHAGGLTMSFGAELPEAASVAAVHESALRVLERTGVLVQDDEAVALLRSRGARCDGRRVFLDEDSVQAALATAPSSFVLAGRRPELGLPLGGADGRVFGSGSGAAYMLEGRAMRRGTLADLEATAKLGHQLPAIDFNSDCMEPLDLPEEVRTRRGTHARLVAERQGDRVGRLGRRGRRRRRAHQRDPLRRGLARAPARPDRPEHHRAAADLRRRRRGSCSAGPGWASPCA